MYNLQGKLPDGTHVQGSDRRSVRWFVRWRVNGAERKRTFRQKGHATSWRDHLDKARLMGWPADDRGWPIDPTAQVAHVADGPVDDTTGGDMSFADYCDDIWYPAAKTDWSHKNRISHRHNYQTAIGLLRYTAGDPRVRPTLGVSVGDSIRLKDIVADDVLAAIAARKRMNGTTAAVNRRRIAKAYEVGSEDVDLLEERASEATVRGFYITLAMILRAAYNSERIPRNPLVGTSKRAPKPKQARMSDRVVPSIDEVFDLADAIAELGPLGSDGRPAGERFRSLVLCGGTLAPRPGELAAHRPEWIEWDSAPVVFWFKKTEAAIYDPREGIRGRQVRPLKHRADEDARSVPALAAVADALKTHFERGYASADRTWTSATGSAGLDWHNLTDTYWKPACEKVFRGSAKPQLASMTPSILRKAAITFWLDSGITPYLASDWAGHSEDVSRRYYAGRASTSFATEAALLTAHRGATA
ncbi:hypothetical protein [Nocardioides zhouii]|uniref:Tyr recombinase domain-containing protein n=1 Tax=Nocardioides zhouii TaxID=1168729 RepID=A0A4Q2SJ94_9ACTN|nr:hypothetical protein [Nocardioides zhouii]RYC05635.1 hypothetical protein EUA94_17970 [Nocardioides zhouii]